MAGNLIVLRRRIKSVKNTQKLTKAMKTVAAAKLRRASGELKRSWAYREKIAQLLREAAAQSQKGTLAEPTRSPKGTGAIAQPLLTGNAQGAALLVVVASDKGLCGAFNSHVLRQGEARYRELAAAGREVILFTVGAKASRYFSKRHMEPRKAYNGMLGRLQFADAVRLAADLQELFLSAALHSVEFAFSEFVSASKQQFALRRLFPVEVAAPLRPPAAGADPEVEGTIFEPSADALFQALLSRHVTATVYRVLLQSLAAEQVARMVAMDLASRNASDMIRELTLQLNKMRQAAITKELLEIITATEALNQ
jgi:F-type H+-transporting ATPase subunit gamma